MLGKPRILCFFPNFFNKFNKTLALMEDPLCIYNFTLKPFVYLNLCLSSDLSILEPKADFQTTTHVLVIFIFNFNSLYAG